MQLITQCLLKPGNQVNTNSQGVLRCNGVLYVGENGELHKRLIAEVHTSAVGGHSGINVTLKKLQQIFYWPNMTTQVKEFVRQCHICQQMKSESVASPGLLQPLQIPTQVWADIAMNFIDGLLKSDGKDSIMVVIDKLSKSCHFIPLTHPYSAQIVAQEFF